MGIATMVAAGAAPTWQLHLRFRPEGTLAIDSRRLPWLIRLVAISSTIGFGHCFMILSPSQRLLDV